MIKKTLFLICMLLSLTGAGAQSWTIYPLYNGKFSDIVETPSKLYYSSNGSLYSYDKDTQETYAYTNANKLSDCIVTDIQYNSKNKYLLVVYENTNMDVIYDDGRVVNMPEIVNANLTVNKVINSVTMQDDYISIATNFGYVIYDAEKLVVKESRNWSVSLTAVAIWRDRVVLQNDTKTLVATLDSPHSAIGDFKQISSNAAAKRFFVINDQLFTKHRSSNTVFRVISVDFDNYTSDLQTTITPHARTDWFKPYSGGYYIVSDTKIYNFDNKGNQTGVTELPQLFQKSMIGKWSEDSKIWHGSTDGIGRFDIGGSSPVVLNEYYRPEGGVCQHVAWISQSADGERVYLTSGSSMTIRPCNGTKYSGGAGALYSIQTTDMVENGTMYDVSYNDTKEFEANAAGRRAGDGQVVEDPVDNSVYYLASRFDGVRVIDRNTGEQIARYSQNKKNAPFTGWGNNVYALGFDRFNNLWALSGMEPDAPNHTHIAILPAEKLRDPKNVEKSDWIEHNFPNSYRNHFETVMTTCRYSDNIVLISSGYGLGALFIDTKGTSSPSDDREAHHNSFIDQDGNTFYTSHYLYAAEDHRGKVWIGSQDGVIEVDPREAFNADFRCNRIKVPRNDGTNYADYLLAGEQVNWISVDPADRKWIATQNSGIYLVSETGDRILEHYTTENSPLPSNTVNCIEASKIDNKVYIGTNYGTIVYSSDAAPAADNLDNVYAYPNPVRPDYTGWITVNGLMDNSLVKITDAQGALVYQGRSEGGMMVWDGCNLGGERVRAGIYFVLASENESGSNYSAVTKIMVIN
ncbi:MAG: hypothetical protein K2L80_08655 [Muribaculaceae bacterium]|nr:hypothetical protein [Muribaculaceae bacterium]MDE6332659.1 hypothetical protein [Muribaculaceae bacterium]